MKNENAHNRFQFWYIQCLKCLEEGYLFNINSEGHMRVKRKASAYEYTFRSLLSLCLKTIGGIKTN